MYDVCTDSHHLDYKIVKATISFTSTPQSEVWCVRHESNKVFSSRMVPGTLPSCTGFTHPFELLFRASCMELLVPFGPHVAGLCGLGTQFLTRAQ